MTSLSLADKLASGWFWRVPSDLDLTQPALTDDAVGAAQTQLGVRLPEAYLALLKRQNGGLLRATWPASYVKAIRGIGPGQPSITRDGARWRPALLAAGAWAPPQPHLLVPFDGDEHWSICFDYRQRGPAAEPSITMVDAECEELEPVAKSFAGFLAGLVDELDECARVRGEVDAEGVARALAERLGSAAPRLDSGARGFQSWRIALPGDHQWCWVSPNRVAASFRRDAATQRLVFGEGTALQIPEDPECKVLVSRTRESAAKVDQALSALGVGLAVAG